MASLLGEEGGVELPLFGGCKGEEIGRISVACQLLPVLKKDLVASLSMAAAEKKRDAYLIRDLPPISAGDLVDEIDSSGGDPAELGYLPPPLLPLLSWE